MGDKKEAREERATSRYLSAYLATLFLALVFILYPLSVGPAQYLASSMFKHGMWKDGYQTAFEVVYYPLLELKARSGGKGQFYFDWWAALAD